MKHSGARERKRDRQKFQVAQKGKAQKMYIDIYIYTYKLFVLLLIVLPKMSFITCESAWRAPKKEREQQKHIYTFIYILNGGNSVPKTHIT